VFRGASGKFDGGVGTRKRSRNTERDHQNWETNLATDNNDSTYPNSDMSDPQINGTAEWHAELDTAIDLYRAEKFQECIAHTRTVFRDNTPLYPRLRYYMLLACCLDDWHEAEDMRFHAENTYTSWCLFNPTGSFPGADKVQSDMRTNLDRIADDLKTFRAEDWKETQRFWNVIEAAEREEEYAAEWAEYEDEEEAAATNSEEEAAATNSEEEAAATNSEEEAAVTNSEEEAAATNSEEEAAAIQLTNPEENVPATNSGEEAAAIQPTNPGENVPTTNSEEDAVVGAEREEEDAVLGAERAEEEAAATYSEQDAVLGAEREEQDAVLGAEREEEAAATYSEEDAVLGAEREEEDAVFGAEVPTTTTEAEAGHITTTTEAEAGHITTAIEAKDEEDATTSTEQEGVETTTTVAQAEEEEDATAGAERVEVPATTAQAEAGRAQGESEELADLYRVEDGANVGNTKRSRSTRNATSITAASTRSPRATKPPVRYAQENVRR
jgi:hypothetical protein